MKHVSLGRTGLEVPQFGFGALPIQRTPVDESTRILQRAYDAGVRFFDTARGYSDSEQKLHRAFGGAKPGMIVATKTLATDFSGAQKDLETSLKTLGVDVVDIMQLHNPERVADPNDSRSAYAYLMKAKEQGKIRFVGITNHRRRVAEQAVISGLFDTLQFPISHISSPEDLAIIDLCKQHDVGLIAMKALCGGLITSAGAAHAFFEQLPTVLPIWGVQHLLELEQFIELYEQPRALTPDLHAQIERDRNDLSGSFCRGCGYCLPCEAGVPIAMAARMSLLLRRAPYAQFLTPEWQANMRKIADCTHCGGCSSRCPYELDTPNLLALMLRDYEAFLADNWSGQRA